MSEDQVSPVELAASIVAAYVEKNAVPQTDLPSLIQSVYGALVQLGAGPKPVPVEALTLTPAVPIKKSVTQDFLICLEDGKQFKSLKRHLKSSYDMTPAQYRAKWNLPGDYPMVAPSYAEKRSAIAKSVGLGQKTGMRNRKRPA